MIDRDDPVPVYIQIKDDIFNKIETDKYEPGKKLPSERKLAEKYDVTRVTVNKALDLLSEQGYIKSKRGAGTFVKDRKHTVKGGEKNIIGVLIPNISRGIMSDLVRGIEDVAINNDYNTILCNTDNKLEKANRYVDQLLDMGAKGVIYYPLQTSNYDEKEIGKFEQITKKLIESNLKLVFVDHDCKNYTTNLVVTENFGGGLKMTNHLLDMGHSRIGIVYRYLETSIKERISGYKEALKRKEIEFNSNLIQKVDGETNSGKDFPETIKLMKEELDVTAIFALNDLLAKKIYYHCDNMGINIPGDLSVVGFDNLQFTKEISTPLTTIHQPLYKMGRESIKLLLDKFQKPEEDGRLIKIISQNKLVKRESVKKLN